MYNKYIQYIEEHEKQLDTFKTSKNENIYETNELISILYKKWEDEKIRKANYVGDILRYIPVTNLISCPRMLTYTRSDKYKPDLEIASKYPYSELITNVGQFIHDYIAKILGIYEITKKYLIIDEYKIRGKCDGILYNALIEIKTEEYLPKTINKNHLIQARILFDMARKNGFENIDLIKILYIKRNLKEFKEFNIHVDIKENEKFVQHYYEIGKHIYECLEKKVLSDKVNRENCIFCVYNKICEYSGTFTNPTIKEKQIPTNVTNPVKNNTPKITKNIEQNKTDNEIEWID